MSIGYRVKPKRGIFFRKWSIKIISNYPTKSYTLDKTRVTLYIENHLELNNSILKLENKVSYHDNEINNIKETLKNKNQTEKEVIQGDA